MSTATECPDFTGLTFEKVWAVIQESHLKIAIGLAINVRCFGNMTLLQ